MPCSASPIPSLRKLKPTASTRNGKVVNGPGPERETGPLAAGRRGPVHPAATASVLSHPWEGSARLVRQQWRRQAWKATLSACSAIAATAWPSPWVSSCSDESSLVRIALAGVHLLSAATSRTRHAPSALPRLHSQHACPRKLCLSSHILCCRFAEGTCGARSRSDLRDLCRFELRRSLAARIIDTLNPKP